MIVSCILEWTGSDLDTIGLSSNKLLILYVKVFCQKIPSPRGCFRKIFSSVFYNSRIWYGSRPCKKNPDPDRRLCAVSLFSPNHPNDCVTPAQLRVQTGLPKLRVGFSSEGWAQHKVCLTFGVTIYFLLCSFAVYRSVFSLFFVLLSLSCSPLPLLYLFLLFVFKKFIFTWFVMQPCCCEIANIVLDTN